MTTRVYIGTTNRNTAEEHTMTAAYKRPHTNRATSNYTLTLTVEDPAPVVRHMQDYLAAAGITRQATVLDGQQAGVAWRSADDAAAQQVAHDLMAAVSIFSGGGEVFAARLHTGYGIHTRELETA